MKRGARSGIHNRPESVLFSSIEAVEERQLLSAATSPIDGVGHNESSPWWGSTETELIRYASPAYEDGISSPAGSNRPGARLVSNQIVAQAESILNDRQMSDFVWMWGQLIDHDIDLTDPAVPAEDFSIDVPAGDPWFDPLATGTVQIDLARSVSVEGEESSDGMRQQLNSITAWLDGSVVYGSSNERANALRSFDGGRLRTSEGNLLPYNDAGLPNAGGSSSSLFLAGDVRANENIALSSMHTLWVREHNRLCEELSAADSSLTDQELYEKARSIVAAEIQVITYNEFLPALLGNHAIAPYAGYDSSVNPTIANEFSTAAYRFGHSLLSPSLQRIDAFGNSIPEGALPLASAFFNPPALLSTGIDVLFRGAAVQAAQELDVQIVDGVRNFLFGEPGQGGLDLASLNIQRGRDHGLADYNTTREAMGLPRVSSFDDISSNPMVAAALELTYGNVDNIDLWVGGLAEDHLADSSMGITFTTILVDQFQRLRDGDRFWYENIFTGTELQTLRNTTLAEVIERNTDVQFAQSNVFFTPNSEIIEFEFAPTGIRRATVKAVNEYIQIVDDVSGNIVFMHNTNDLSGLIIVGNEKLADRLVVDGSITAEMLPNGIDFRAGNVGRDRLVVHGTSGDDTVTVNGNSVNLNDLDVFFEYIDELMVEGAAGDDTLTIVHPCVNKTILDGGDGNDLLVGGDSNDELYGGYGNDILRGGNGDDKLYGGPGADQLYGEGGVDQLIGGGGFDLIVEDGNEQSPDVAPRYAAFLDQFYNLRFLGNDYYNWSGRQERWFYSNKGWMFILPDGSIHLWDRLPGANGPFIGRVEVSCYQNLNELCDHSTPFNDEDTLDGVANLARQLDEQLQLRFWGSYIYNWGGRQEKWIPGKNGWYCITRDGRLWFWDGSRNSEGTLIAELNIMYFSSPALLHDAWNG